ncbi:phage holin family protein [Luteococcus sediminum]|uniref:phage holin family protein n=1 Tax=Luteococcus sp. TaxID=1969402 RepID=UPI003736D31F
MSGAHVPGDRPTAHGVAAQGKVEDPRSLGEIVSDLTENFSTLVHQEMELAKAEIKQDAARAGKGAGMVGGAGIAAHLALTFLSLAAWWTLAVLIGNHDHPALGWAGLIMAVLWGIVAAVLAQRGKKEFDEVDGLPRTTETAKKIPNALKGNEEKNR